MINFFKIPRFGLQAPLIPLAGGLIAGGGTMAGLATGAGMAGMAVGSAVSGMVGASGKGGRISAPTNRSYLGEMKDALSSQASIQDQLLSQQNQYVPMYQQMQQNALQGQMGSLNTLYQSAIPQANQLQAQMLQGQGSLYGQVGQYATNAYNNTIGAGAVGLQDTMMRQAQEGLNAGTGLTDQQTQLAQQSARAAMAARGLQGGNQAIGQEILNSYRLGQERQTTNRAYAQQALGNANQASQNAMSMYGTPLMAQMNQVSPTAYLNSANSMYGSLNQNMLFQPESQYNAGIYGANQSNQMQTQLGNLQARSGTNNAMIGLGGTVLGSLGKGGFFNGISSTPSDSESTWDYTNNPF